MKSLKLKLLLIILIIGIFTIGMPMMSYGTNENTIIVEEGKKALIYLQGYLDKDFSFAFSNDKDQDVSKLTFINSAVDSPNADANHIAFIEDTEKITKPLYIWIKLDNNLEVKARELNIEDNILKNDLENVSNVSQKIKIKLDTEKIVDTQNAEGTKITKTVGVVKIEEPLQNAKYQLIKVEDNSRLFNLAEILGKNEFTDAYTKIAASKEFLELTTTTKQSLAKEKWAKIENNKIYQPEDTKTGEKYILWIEDNDLEDVHFLTSKRIDNEKTILEEIRTKLPKTYDNNIALVFLGIVIVAIILIAIRIAILKKKEMSN